MGNRAASARRHSGSLRPSDVPGASGEANRSIERRRIRGCWQSPLRFAKGQPTPAAPVHRRDMPEPSGALPQRRMAAVGLRCLRRSRTGCIRCPARRPESLSEGRWRVRCCGGRDRRQTAAEDAGGAGIAGSGRLGLESTADRSTDAARSRAPDRRSDPRGAAPRPPARPGRRPRPRSAGWYDVLTREHPP